MPRKKTEAEPISATPTPEPAPKTRSKKAPSEAAEAAPKTRAKKAVEAEPAPEPAAAKSRPKKAASPRAKKASEPEPAPTGPAPLALDPGCTPGQIAAALEVAPRDLQKAMRSQLDMKQGLDALLEEETAERIAAHYGRTIAWNEVAESEPEPEPVVEAKPKPKARARKKSWPEIVDPEGRLVPVWRPKTERPAEAATGEDSESVAPALDEQGSDAGEDKDGSKRRRRRRRSRGKGGEKGAVESVSDVDDEQDDQDEVEEPAVEAPKVELRKSRSKPKDKRPAAEEPEAVEPPSAPATPPGPARRQPTAAQPAPPVQPKRERIPIPADAPQVVVHNGAPVLIRDRQVTAPIFFFASAMDEPHLETVLEEVRMAAENGVHIFSLLAELEVSLGSVNEAAGFAAYLIKAVSEVDPEAQVILRVAFTAPEGWEQRFPNARYKLLSGGIGDPSLSDDGFWEEAELCLQRLIERVLKTDVGSRLIGIHLERGEWFHPHNDGYDRSRAAEGKFRQWLRHRYGNDVVSLRASWFDGRVDFESAAIPDFRAATSSPGDFVRLDRRARRWVDYHLFLSDAGMDRIADLAYTVKKASGGRLLVGSSYGYTFEWSHAASGHLSLGKLLRCPEIDYVAGPPSYKTREPGGSAAFPWPVDSIALNGKLAVSEEDFKTPISGGKEPDTFNPVMKTPLALESVHWRGAGSALAHGGGVCWMDTWGNGWLNSRGIWERGAAVRQSMMWRIGTEAASPDVAMFIDERSLAYLVDGDAFAVLVQNVREAILRSGLSVGFYLLSDLAHRENFPEAKLHVFVNAWDIRPEVRSAIKSRLQRDNKVLFWLYSAGLFEGGRESLERAREATGIALRPQPFNSKPGTALVNTRDPLCRVLPEGVLAEGGQLEPSYFAIPEDAHVLGEYVSSGLPSFVVRRFPSPGASDEPWTSVFLGEPVVTPGLFRALGEMAGCHVWNHDDDVVHVRAPFLTVHCTGAGARTITLPDKWTAYDLVRKEWMTVENSSLKFVSMDGATHSFLVGQKIELEAILNSGEPDRLTEAEILSRQENTVHWDAIKFDVPIMKLDEWVEESWSEEMADDLLLRPSMIDEVLEPEPRRREDEPRSRRRQKDRGRDRRRSGGQGSEESADARKEGADRLASDDAGISFLFRKRE